VLKIRKRIELLEEVILPVDLGPPLILNIDGVDQDGKVVSTVVFTVPQPAPIPLNRRTVRRRAPWVTRW
jgi:hypothetical protein